MELHSCMYLMDDYGSSAQPLYIVVHATNQKGISNTLLLQCQKKEIKLP